MLSPERLDVSVYFLNFFLFYCNYSAQAASVPVEERMADSDDEDYDFDTDLM